MDFRIDRIDRHDSSGALSGTSYDLYAGADVYCRLEDKGYLVMVHAPGSAADAIGTAAAHLLETVDRSEHVAWLWGVEGSCPDDPIRFDITSESLPELTRILEHPVPDQKGVGGVVWDVQARLMVTDVAPLRSSAPQLEFDWPSLLSGAGSVFTIQEAWPEEPVYPKYIRLLSGTSVLLETCLEELTAQVAEVREEIRKNIEERLISNPQQDQAKEKPSASPAYESTSATHTRV